MTDEELIGKKFGKLTVTGTFRSEKGYRMCRCHCDCGRDTTVYYSNLVSGQTKSCGCQMEKSRRQYRDLSGQRFGSVVALRPTEKRGKDGSVIWECRCDCGRIFEINRKNLVRGGCRDCGCGCASKTGHGRKRPQLDLTNRTFGELTALYKTDKRDSHGCVIWHCRCSCGAEKDYSADELLHGRIVSCGHVRSENGKKLHENLHFVENSCVEFLKRKKRSDNTTGITGVYRTKHGTYAANITFNKVRHYLGTYATLEQAVEARREGVEKYHKPFLEKYGDTSE
jgi:hypothetical protein